MCRGRCGTGVTVVDRGSNAGLGFWRHDFDVGAAVIAAAPGRAGGGGGVAPGVRQPKRVRSMVFQALKSRSRLGW